MIKSGEHILKSEYLTIMKTNTNCYWQQLENKKSIIITTHTIVHTCIDVSTIEDVADILRMLCNKKQARKDVQRHTICLSDQINIIFHTKQI